MQWETHREEFLKWVLDHAALMRGTNKCPKGWDHLFPLWYRHIKGGPFGVVTNKDGVVGLGCTYCDQIFTWCGGTAWDDHLGTNNHKVGTLKKEFEKTRKELEIKAERWQHIDEKVGQISDLLQARKGVTPTGTFAKRLLKVLKGLQSRGSVSTNSRSLSLTDRSKKSMPTNRGSSLLSEKSLKPRTRSLTKERLTHSQGALNPTLSMD